MSDEWEVYATAQAYGINDNAARVIVELRAQLLDVELQWQATQNSRDTANSKLNDAYLAYDKLHNSWIDAILRGNQYRARALALLKQAGRWRDGDKFDDTLSQWAMMTRSMNNKDIADAIGRAEQWQLVAERRGELLAEILPWHTHTHRWSCMGDSGGPCICGAADWNARIAAELSAADRPAPVDSAVAKE